MIKVRANALPIVMPEKSPKDLSLVNAQASAKSEPNRPGPPTLSDL